MSVVELVKENSDSEELRVWLNDLVRNQGIKVKTIAEELGCTHSAVSSYLAGRGSLSQVKLQEMKCRLEAKSREQEEKVVRKDSGRRDVGIIQTEDYRRVMGLCELCHRDGTIGLVVGLPGSGKTVALQEYCKLKQGRAVYIKGDGAMAAKELLIEIGEGLGLGYLEGSKYRMLKQIVTRLKGDPVLIIVDEADYLTSKESVKKLEVLRSIWDEAKTGIVLCGHLRLVGYLVKGPGGKENLAQLYSRIRRAYRMNGITREEALDALAGYDVEAAARDHLVKTAMSKAYGGLRRFTGLLKNALELCEDGEVVTLEIIKEADRMTVSPESLGLKF
jgi:DNA transposition AAA+ family ATPase